MRAAINTEEAELLCSCACGISFKRKNVKVGVALLLSSTQRRIAMKKKEQLLFERVQSQTKGNTHKQQQVKF